MHATSYRHSQLQIHPQIQRLAKMSHTIVLTCGFNIRLPPPLTPFSFRDVGCLPIRILHVLAKHQPFEGLLVVVQTENFPSRHLLGILNRIRTPTHHSKADADEARVPSGLPPFQSGTELRPLCNTGGRTSSSPPGSLSCLLASDRLFIQFQTTGLVRNDTLPFSSSILLPPPQHLPFTSHTPKTSPFPKFLISPLSPPPYSPQLGSRPPTETSCLDSELKIIVQLSRHPPTQCPRAGKL